MNRILVIGGYGAVGTNVVAHLRDRRDLKVVIAGRDGSRATRLAAGLGANFNGLALDLHDTTALDRAVIAADVVVSCTEAAAVAVGQACIRHGRGYVPIAASVPILKELFRLDDQARANGAVGLLGVGLAPGVTNVLAADATARAERYDHCIIAVHLGFGDRHGPEAVAWTLRQASQARSPVSIMLPAPVGRRCAVPIEFLDGPALAAKLGNGRVDVYLTLAVNLATRAMPALGRLLGRLHCASPSACSVVWRLLSWAHMGDDQLMVSAEVRGDGAAVRSWMVGRDQSRVTGTVAAEVALRLLKNDLAAGMHAFEEVFSLGDVEAALPFCEFHFTAST